MKWSRLNELSKLKFEVALDEYRRFFQHLVGETYLDYDTLLEFITTRVVEYMDAIVAFRAPVLASGKIGREEKSLIHLADVIRMRAVNARFQLNKPGHELGSGTSRELDSATLNSESSLRSGHRPDRARVPFVDVNTVEHNALVIRRDTQAGVIAPVADEKSVTEPKWNR